MSIWTAILFFFISYFLGRYLTLKKVRRNIILKNSKLDDIIENIKKYAKENNVPAFEIMHPLETFQDELFKDFDCYSALNYFTKVIKAKSNPIYAEKRSK